LIYKLHGYHKLTLSRSRLSKVRALQTDEQTDATERIIAHRILKW